VEPRAEKVPLTLKRLAALTILFWLLALGLSLPILIWADRASPGQEWKLAASGVLVGIAIILLALRLSLNRFFAKCFLRGWLISALSCLVLGPFGLVPGLLVSLPLFLLLFAFMVMATAFSPTPPIARSGEVATSNFESTQQESFWKFGGLAGRYFDSRRERAAEGRMQAAQAAGDRALLTKLAANVGISSLAALVKHREEVSPNFGYTPGSGTEWNPSSTVPAESTAKRSEQNNWMNPYREQPWPTASQPNVNFATPKEILERLSLTESVTKWPNAAQPENNEISIRTPGEPWTTSIRSSVNGATVYSPGETRPTAVQIIGETVVIRQPGEALPTTVR
jgi:hypothetical protein